MPKLTEMERAIRGMERCGYQVYAVTKGPQILGVAELLPDTSKAQPRTEEKWRLKWQEILGTTSRRTIAEHLVGTGRTEAALREKAEFLAHIREAPWSSDTGRHHQ